MKISKIAISALLILCFYLVECIESNFVNEAKWDWKYSCINHPFAVAPGIHSIDASLKVDSCELKFDYPDGLSDDTEEERNAFCKAMFPNHVTSSKKIDGFPITCKYLRNRKCNANSTIVIGDNCVSIWKKAEDFKRAKDLCKLQDGAILIDKDNHQVISFFSRLYQWNKPEAATLALGEGDKPYHLSLGYSAIGNNVPGTSMIVNDPALLNATATVVCVGMANNLQQGSAPIPYCEMISEFLKIPSENVAETCYYATPSVISARHHTADKRLATVDHFNQICWTKHSQLNYAVAPTSTQHKDQLTKFVNGRSKMSFQRCRECPTVETLKPHEVLFRVKFTNKFYGAKCLPITYQTTKTHGNLDASNKPLQMSHLKEENGHLEGVDYRILHCHSQSVYVIASFLHVTSTRIETEIKKYKRIPAYHLKLINALFRMSLSTKICKKTLDAVSENRHILLTMASPGNVMYDQVVVQSILVRGVPISIDLERIYFPPSVVKVVDIYGQSTYMFCSFGYYRMAHDRWCIFFSEDMQYSNDIDNNCFKEARTKLDEARLQLEESAAGYRDARGLSVRKAVLKKASAEIEYKIRAAMYLASSSEEAIG